MESWHYRASKLTCLNTHFSQTATIRNNDCSSQVRQFCEAETVPGRLKWDRVTETADELRSVHVSKQAPFKQQDRLSRPALWLDQLINLVE